MCKCLFVEYTCSCKPDCPHDDPQHRAYHGPDHAFQIDHFRWKHCTSFLLHSGAAVSHSEKVMCHNLNLDEPQTVVQMASPSLARDSFFEEPSKAAPDRSVTSLWRRNSPATAHTVVMELPAKISGDPRHGGKRPACEKIEYEGWRIQSRSCPWCVDYWIGREGAI